MAEYLPSLTAALAGRYTIERELGAGGMATVFLARDERHQRRVAIKVLHPELSATIGPERFLKEIAVTAALQHPHILPLFDSGAAGGLLFYVMPYVEGETLRARLARERQLPVEDAARIAHDLADALEYAHRNGVIHRDIKPENILLHEGRPLLADFGIALAVQQAGDTRFTQTGVSLGTPAYMAPEQAMGEKALDARVDIYALGAVTYEMLAGEPPFTGPTAQAVVARIMTAEAAPVTALRRNVPPALNAAVARALEKIPADRHQSAAAFAAALAAPGLATPGARDTAVVRVPFRPVAAAAAAVALLATGLLAGRYLLQPDAVTATPTTRFLLTPPDSVELQAVCCGQMFTFSPDGNTLVFQGRPRVPNGSPPAPVQLYVRRLDDVGLRAIPGTSDAVSISFSPDGRELAYTERQRLFRVALDGGTPRSVASLPPGYIGGTTWISPDSVVVTVGPSLLAVDMQGGGTRTLYGPDSLSRQPTGPHWVPEGHGVLFSFATLDQTPIVHWLPLNGGPARPLFPGATPRYVPAWKRLVVLQGTTLMAYPFDPVRGDTTGPGIQLADKVVGRSPVLAHAEYSVAPTGTLAMARRLNAVNTGLIHLVDAGRDTVFPVVSSGVLIHARFAPDGNRLSFFVGDVQLNPGDRSRVVYAYDLARKVSQRVSTDPEAREARWTADGDSLVYLLGSSGRLAIQAADGSGTERPLPQVTGWAPTQFSRGKEWLVVAGPSSPGSSSDLGFVHRDSGGRPRPYLTTAFDELDPELSPDGAWLAYTSNDSGVDEVYVSPFPVSTARYRVSTSGGRMPRWDADGRTIYYAGPSTFHAVPFAVTGGDRVTLGTPRTIYRRPSVRTWDVTAGGSRLMFIDTVRLLELLGIEVVTGLDPDALARTR